MIIRRIWKDEEAETKSFLYINAAFWQLDLFEFLQIKSTFQALKMGELTALPMRGHYYLPEAVYLNKMADAFINMAKQCSVGPSSIYAVYAYVNAQRHLPNEGRESPRFQSWDERPHLRVTLGEISKQLFFVYIHVFVTT